MRTASFDAIAFNYIETQAGAAVPDSRDLFGVDVCVVRSQIKSMQRSPSFPRKLLVLGVTVFGNPYVGAEEDRRRTRYAIVSALDSAGYVPTDNERIGYMQVPIEKGSTIALPFEFFERYQTGKPEDPHSRGKLLADHILLYCFQYNPTTGKYSIAIMRVLRTLAVATVLLIAGFIFVESRRKRSA